jgi:hypothetical protein
MSMSPTMVSLAGTIVLILTFIWIFNFTTFF